MRFNDWIRLRWLEMRFGSTSYLTYFVTFFNLAVLVSLRFDISGSGFFDLAVGLLASLASIAVVIGHFHIKWQNPTDVLTQMGPVMDELERRFKQALEESKR